MVSHLRFVGHWDLDIGGSLIIGIWSLEPSRSHTVIKQRPPFHLL